MNSSRNKKDCSKAKNNTSLTFNRALKFVNLSGAHSSDRPLDCFVFILWNFLASVNNV